MTIKYLIGVVHAAHVAIGRERGFVAFSHGKEVAVRNLNVGDKVIFYSPKTNFEGTPVQAFTGHATVTGEEPRNVEYMSGMPAWVRDARFDSVTEVAVKPMLEDLSFVRNKTQWGMAFRQGKFSIPQADYDLISKAMGL